MIRSDIQVKIQCLIVAGSKVTQKNQINQDRLSTLIVSFEWCHRGVLWDR
jgi:hypothetical protein